jgi:hypothetical protein
VALQGEERDEVRLEVIPGVVGSNCDSCHRPPSLRPES